MKEGIREGILREVRMTVGEGWIGGGREDGGGKEEV